MMKKEKGILISASVVVFLVMFPLAALACHVEDWDSQLGCGGYSLSGQVSNDQDLIVRWKVWLFEHPDTTNPVDYQEDEILVGMGQPFLVTRTWNYTCDGVYTARIEASAHYVGGGTAGPGHSKEVEFPCESPSAVTLASFSASPAGNAVAIEWATATQVDNLGFNLYRAETVNGLRVRLNATLIPSQMPGSPAGASYQFVDESVRPGITYYYWLEDVDVYGAATVHGPVSAQVSPVRRLLPVRARPAPRIPILQGQ